MGTSILTVCIGRSDNGSNMLVGSLLFSLLLVAETFFHFAIINAKELIRAGRHVHEIRFICILQRKDRQSIAITPCAAEHPMSFKVPDRLLTDGQCRMMINGIQFIQALLEANGLAAGKDHQFKGRYDAEKNAVIISLEKDEQSALSPQKCTT